MERAPKHRSFQDHLSRIDGNIKENLSSDYYKSSAEEIQKIARRISISEEPDFEIMGLQLEIYGSKGTDGKAALKRSLTYWTFAKMYCDTDPSRAWSYLVEASRYLGYSDPEMIASEIGSLKDNTASATKSRIDRKEHIKEDLIDALKIILKEKELTYVELKSLVVLAEAPLMELTKKNGKEIEQRNVYQRIRQWMKNDESFREKIYDLIPKEEVKFLKEKWGY